MWGGGWNPGLGLGLVVWVVHLHVVDGVCMLVVCVVLLVGCGLATNLKVCASLGRGVCEGRGWGQGIHGGNGVVFGVG